jgi:hypothetical protein
LSDLITIIPADEYLPERRRVEAISESPMTVDSNFMHPEYAQVRVNRYAPSSLSIMVAGHTYATGVDDYEFPVASTNHVEFSPEQAEALAVALMNAAAEARLHDKQEVTA